MTRIALNGAGRMSAAIVKAAAQDVDTSIVAVVAPTRPDWAEALAYFPALEQLDGIAVDVLVDFSLPAGTANAARWCARSGVALLSGVTGLRPVEMDALQLTARSSAVLWSPNLSVGVNLLARLCTVAAGLMQSDTQVSIADTHHQWKQDAPSGTALMLGAAINAGRLSGVPEISYSSIREGEIIGHHRVTLEWASEKIVLHHEALDRSLFAHGALDAARWLSTQSTGFYSAADWLAGR